MKIMKSIRIMIMACLLALSAMQASAVTYKNCYSRTEQTHYMAQQAPYTSEATFRSTSSMVLTGSAYSSNPTLNDNGMATYDSPSRGPRRAKKADENNDGYDDDTDLPVTPGNTGKQQPIGDAVVPLMLFALAYAGYKVLTRRKKSAQRE